jgi:CDP-diacylglycerol--glycerol-3-phosphate 3-phosphatidyltransferase
MAAGRSHPAWLRHLPNVLSASRALAVPVLFVLALGEQRAAFTWVLIPALLSDILDGLIARLFHLESRLGAILDSIADSLLLFVAVYGIWVFHPEVLRDHAWLCGIAVGLWALEDVLALLRYRRLSSFHTYLSKIVANVLGLFIGGLFLFGFEPWLLYVAAGMSIVASLEELALLKVLPRWRADVRGLWWVLRERRPLSGANRGSRAPRP